MPFASTTRDRVMACLDLPVTIYYVERVQDALDHALVYGGETFVARLEGILTKIEQQESSLNAEALNAGLIQADVLRWEEGGKTSGIKNELSRLKNKVARSLLLDHLVKGNGVRLRRD